MNVEMLDLEAKLALSENLGIPIHSAIFCQKSKLLLRGLIIRKNHLNNDYVSIWAILIPKPSIAVIIFSLLLSTDDLFNRMVDQ
jgi:hypothetical protein